MPSADNRNRTAQRDWSRRDWLQLASSTAVAALGSSVLLPQLLHGEDRAAGMLKPPNRFSRMVHEYFVEQVRAAEQAGLQLKTSLRTKDDAEAYVRGVQQKIRACFGPEPERTPLKPRIMGTLERDAYKIEKVIFESRPDFLVTGNLYIPKNRKFPLPGVVGSCGHATAGKAMDAYQSFAQGLARQGYVVLIFDPIGQGERLQYTDQELRPRFGVGVKEHLLAGNQQFLVDEFFGAWRAWDGIRALDYLLSRTEVDPQHVGITGNSGGGTMTTWLCGLERRWTMAAPSCFITTFRRNIENELAADTEQCPPGVFAKNLDMDDFLAAMAPKPVIILAQERDFFDVRGSAEAYSRLKHLYALLGAEENVKLFVGPREHGYSQESREAMYGWFNRQTKISSAEREPDLIIEPEAALWCTPRGQVAELQSRTVYSFTKDRSRQLARERSPLAGAELRTAVREVLKLGKQPAHPPDFRILRPLPAREYPQPFSTTYAIETEPEVFALVTRLSEILHYARPQQQPNVAILYVADQSSDQELRSEPLVRELLKENPEATLYACDVRGIGESQPDTCGADSFHLPYGNDYFYAVHAIMLDRPYAGQRTWDLLRVVDWLTSFGHRQVHLAAKGWGAIPGTFAALLSDRITQVTLKENLTSFSEVAETEEYRWPLSAFVRGILTRCDLLDCYRELEKSKHLKQIDPRGAGVAATEKG